MRRIFAAIVAVLFFSPAASAAPATDPGAPFRSVVTTHSSVVRVVVIRTDDRSRETYLPQRDGTVLVRYMLAEYRESNGQVVCPRTLNKRLLHKRDLPKVSLQYRVDFNHSVTVFHADGTVETFVNPDQSYAPVCLPA